MLRNIIILGTLALTATSCVSRRLYNELDANYKNCQSALANLTTENEKNSADLLETMSKNKMLENQLATAIAERDKLQTAYDLSAKNYTELEKNADAAMRAEYERLQKLRADLDAKSNRVAELESKLDAQNRNLRQLKDALSKALFEFEGNGLTVVQKDGKVYVSMENKLLFPSGSWTVSKEGRNAVNQLASVLAQNPDISVLIEGHTDNDQIVGTLGGGITSNWDLSTKRATAIVNILAENNRIDKRNLTAAGRSEYAPIASNSTADGKAKNRRIEVILTPKLDEISKMLNEL